MKAARLRELADELEEIADGMAVDEDDGDDEEDDGLGDDEDDEEDEVGEFALRPNRSARRY